LDVVFLISIIFFFCLDTKETKTYCSPKLNPFSKSSVPQLLSRSRLNCGLLPLRFIVVFFDVLNLRAGLRFVGRLIDCESRYIILLSSTVTVTKKSWFIIVFCIHDPSLERRTDEIISDFRLKFKGGFTFVEDLMTASRYITLSSM
jgi:hypothetical protein